MRKLSATEVAGLIPQYWDLTAEKTEDIIFFGQVTIREMVRSWRYHSKSQSSLIKSTDDLLSFLRGKNAKSISKVAEKYESPEFPKIGLREGNWSGDPEPLDAESINREGDATTFNFCGWCKHAGGGTCRFRYHITTRCGIKTSAGFEDEERRFDTPCFLTDAPNAEFDRLREGLERERNRLIEVKRGTDKKIRTLLNLEKQAEMKPALPSQRPHDWFNLNDPLVCYIGLWEERIVKDDFVTAKVIDGYRHHDGCVSVNYDGRIHNGEYLEGHGGGYGMSRPEIMHAWECEYLLANSDFAHLWATKGTGRHLERFDAEKFMVALGMELGKRARIKK